VATALQHSTLADLQLPKLERLLLDVLDRLAAVEVQSGAYSRAVMEQLMRWPQAQAAASSSAGSSNGSSSGDTGGSGKVRRVGGRSSSSGSSSAGEIGTGSSSSSRSSEENVTATVGVP